MTWSRIDQETFPTSIRMCKLTEVDGRGISDPYTTKSKAFRSNREVNDTVK